MGGSAVSHPAVSLCLFDTIADPGARGFEVDTPGGRLDVIVVRRGDRLHGFVNCCPHQGTPLETFPDRFLSRDGGVLICSTHGARFRTGDGMCIAGPCKGRPLQPVPVEKIGADVVLHVGNTGTDAGG